VILLSIQLPAKGRWSRDTLTTQTTDRIFAEYALRDLHKPIGLAEYELTRSLPSELASSLPSIEDIENELTDSPSQEGAE